MEEFDDYELGMDAAYNSLSDDMPDDEMQRIIDTFAGYLLMKRVRYGITFRPIVETVGDELYHDPKRFQTVLEALDKCKDSGEFITGFFTYMSANCKNKVVFVA